MRHMKKYFTEGLIQFTILLSLIGVRVDVDTYLNGYLSPLIEIDGGPSSAFIQTPFHLYRDTGAGHQVHLKCPELDYYFTSRRLLNEVRALGSPARFPTHVSAWLVHVVPDDGSDVGEPHDQSGDSGNDEVNTEDLRDEVENERRTGEGLVLSVSQDQTISRPCCVDEELSKEDTLLNQENEDDEVKNERGQEEISLDSVSQLTRSSALEQEDSSSNALPPPISGLELTPQWQDFLSEFDDFDSQRISDLEVDLPNPISYNVSLQDAMVTRGDSTSCRPTFSRAPLFRLESTNSSHSDPSQSSAGALPSSLFSLMGNSSLNETSHLQVGGYLDEAVFEQINMMDLGTIDPRMLDCLQGDMDTPWLEDSDSGLSLESSSRSPASPSTSSDSFCEDEGEATGYSSEVESLSSKEGACAATYRHWSPVNLNDNIWHDHTYSVPQAQNSTSTGWVQPIKVIKQEVMSEDEVEPEEMSRDEQRVQALGLPFSAFQIVNMRVDDFLEMLDRQNLSVSEVMLLRDVRRRGKNKLAAQNCRKRKLDAIMSLQGEVEVLAAQREALLRQKSHTSKALFSATEHFQSLSRTVLSHLRDEYGQPLSYEHYALQCSANGRVVVQPRTNTTSRTMTGVKTKRKKDKKP
ncbi:endoplasmic reticulum membrane sensor NFE2L1-like isoform X1 [Xyrauchen texanus]|uniref:endoplasmic reticulum membrane sensor NFE2L1-like isoform X1 n=1 Tax=Xyrauchen texanus TaxID=154827 RepID=UPI0022428DC4|nr:endoplasmic reticulum membrane sensor NFE2L1-like isoform X1 [Xyrauchen texanus]